MTLTRWIIAAVVIAAVVTFALFNFTSFQIPKSLTEGPKEPQVGGGLTGVQGNTQTCTNLDRVYNKTRGLPECGPTSATEGNSNGE